MKKIKFTTKQLARAGIIATLYAVLSIVLSFISYGPIQVRISESLTILPLLFPESIYGLTIGCLISNLFGNGALDIIFGTIATLIAAILTNIIGKFIKNKYARFFVGAIPPIIINAVVVPFVILVQTELKELYFITFVQILIGQAISVLVIGFFVYIVLDKLESEKRI